MILIFAPPKIKLIKARVGAEGDEAGAQFVGGQVLGEMPGRRYGRSNRRGPRGRCLDLGGAGVDQCRVAERSRSER